MCQESFQFWMALEHPINSRNATQKTITQTEPDCGLAQPRIQKSLVNPVHHFHKRLFTGGGKSRDQGYPHRRDTKNKSEVGNLHRFEHIPPSSVTKAAAI